MNQGVPPDLLQPERSGERIQGIQVIARASAILRVLRDRPEGLSLGELSKMVGLPRSTVQRIVDALHDEHFIMSASARRGVRLGPGLIALAAGARFEIVELARPTLELLAQESGETVDLSIMDGEQIVFVDQIIGMHRLRAVSAVGVGFALHASANGKACLAALDTQQLESLLSRLKLVAMTERTLTSLEPLRRELDAIRESGVALDVEEQSIGVCAMGMALHLPAGGLAALSIPVPTQRFETIRERLQSLLLMHGQRLQERLRRVD